MRGRPPIACIAFAVLSFACGETASAAGFVESAQTPTVESPQHKEVEQIAPRQGGDPVRVEEIAPLTGPGIDVEQAEGRDLCGPEVSPAQRLAAGVDCERIMESTDADRQILPAPDALLEPRREDLREEFDALGLDEDVPATVILQQ